MGMATCSTKTTRLSELTLHTLARTASTRFHFFVNRQTTRLNLVKQVTTPKTCGRAHRRHGTREPGRHTLMHPTVTGRAFLRQSGSTLGRVVNSHRSTRPRLPTRQAQQIFKSCASVNTSTSNRVTACYLRRLLTHHGQVVLSKMANQQSIPTQWRRTGTTFG